MKIRNGFVSNSSSSSFMIWKTNLSAKQVYLIQNHIEFGSKFGIEYVNEHDRWNLEENENFIKGDTMMDNFDMREFLHAIGVPDDCVEWDEEKGW